jgi:hypothetical protein
MTFTRYDLRSEGHWIKKFLNIFPYVLAYFGINIHYFTVVNPKSAHHTVLYCTVQCTVYINRNKSLSFFSTFYCLEFIPRVDKLYYKLGGYNIFLLYIFIHCWRFLEKHR